MKLDLLLRNADIITMDGRRPHASSLGIWQGRIVGLDEDLDGLAAAEVLDLDGATVTPGFIDAHCHTTWFGLGLGEVDVSGARGLDQLYALLDVDMAADTAAKTAAGDGPAQGWLMATGFSQTHHGGEFPDIAVLDRITGERPLFIRHNSGHMAVVNTAALRLAGAESASYPDPDGGVIVRDAAGRPTGLVQETAQQLIQQLVLPYSLEAIETALDRATRHYASEGITSFTEAGIGGGWIGHSPVELAAYQRAAAGGRLHARAQLMPVLDVLHPLDGHGAVGAVGLDLGMYSGFGNDLLSLGPAKVFLDGSLLGETAAVSEDYCSHGHTDNTGNTGYFQAEPEALRNRIEAAYAAGWSIAAHAIGDRAMDLAIGILTDCAEKYGPRALPNRIEHASVTRPDQVRRLADAGIAVTPQASFFSDGGDGMTASLGPDRIDWAYRAASFLAAGVTLAGSSDRPVADGNVLRGMQAFVDRRTSSGRVFGNPDERLTPRQALAAYTSGAAAATGAAQAKGTLTPGKLADFTVLSGSPLTAPDIAGLRILATAVGGEFTHRESSVRSPVPTGQADCSPSAGTTVISTATNCSQESTVTTTTTLSAQDTAFVRDFYTMSEFGATANGGVDRQAASIPDGQQRRWLKDLLEAKGFTVKFDRAGNEWGLFEAVPGAPYVVVGSHMDSQPTAGRYDGAYGVLAAAHAAFRLVEKWGASGTDGQPKFNIAVVNWFNEEGSRFKPSMMGSSVYTGKLDLEAALATTDAAGATVRDALDAIGCRGDYDGPEAAYCAEIHIEQGRSMEREGITIGLVHSNWAANKYEFVVHGEQAHTGSTVIADRKDALLGASMLVVAARELADRFPGVLHTSVGQLNVYPNSPVVVPSRVNLLLDLRSADEAVLAEADTLLHRRIAEIERLANITVERNHSHSWPVTPYQPEGVELAAKVAADLGLTSKEVMTLAGHDSTNMKDLVPTVMLFVPSVDGISHNEHEYTTDEDIVAGLAMLTEVVNRLCNGVLED